MTRNDSVDGLPLPPRLLRRPSGPSIEGFAMTRKKEETKPHNKKIHSYRNSIPLSLSRRGDKGVRLPGELSGQASGILY